MRHKFQNTWCFIGLCTGESVMERTENIAVGWLSGEATAEGRDTAGERTRAFETLATEQARMVFRVAYSVLRNSHDAEDVVQETFLSAWLARFEDAEDPKAWLAKIAWRAAVKKAKPRPEQSSEEELEISSSTPDPEQQAAAQERRELLDRMIAALPEELRTALVLSTMGELNSREAAAVLGIPEASVRTRLFRAREMLKQKLAEMDGRAKTQAVER